MERMTELFLLLVKSDGLEKELIPHSKILNFIKSFSIIIKKEKYIEFKTSRNQMKLIK